MSAFEFCILFCFVTSCFAVVVAISDRARLRDAKRFIAAILSNETNFIRLIQSGQLIDPGYARLLILDTSHKLDHRLHDRLRRALNEPNSDELVFEIAVVSKVLTDKREPQAPKITIVEDAVMLRDLFLISGSEVQQAT